MRCSMGMGAWCFQVSVPPPPSAQFHIHRFAYIDAHKQLTMVVDKRQIPDTVKFYAIIPADQNHNTLPMGWFAETQKTIKSLCSEDDEEQQLFADAKKVRDFICVSNCIESKACVSN